MRSPTSLRSNRAAAGSASVRWARASSSRAWIGQVRDGARGERPQPMGTGEVTLRTGDVALVQGDPSGGRVGEDARHVVLQAAVLDDLPRSPGRRSGRPAQSPRSIANTERSARATETVGTAPYRSPSSAASSIEASAASASPASLCEMPSRSTAVARNWLPLDRPSRAILASLAIWSIPSRHSSERSSASQEAIEELPSGKVPSNDARSAASAQRSASAGCPVSARSHAHWTAAGG